MTSPAFYWYPKDFETDERVMLMNNAQRGVYLRFLNHSWLHDGIPNNEDLLAKIACEPMAIFRKLWPGISPCWVEVESGRLVNPRQEKERVKIIAHRQAKQEAGRRGGVAKHEAGKRLAVLEQCQDSAIGENLAKSSIPYSIVHTPLEEEYNHVQSPPNGGGKASWKKAKFEEFWSVVWAKKARGNAQPVFERHAKTPEIADQIIAAAKKQGPGIIRNAAKNGHTPVFPATWLNGQRWLDEDLPLIVDSGDMPDTDVYDKGWREERGL